MYTISFFFRYGNSYAIFTTLFCSNGNFVNMSAVGNPVDKSEDNVFKKEKRCYFFYETLAISMDRL